MPMKPMPTRPTRIICRSPKRLARGGPAVYNRRRRKQPRSGANKGLPPQKSRRCPRYPPCGPLSNPGGFHVVPCRLLLFCFGRRSGVPDSKLAFEKYTLPNGLDVILHEDHSTPIVGVNVWYHVGSKNERPGRTGFAHLFEHMMFQGSQHYDKDYFGPIADGRRQAERLDRHGPHQLLGDRARRTTSNWPCGWSRTAWASCCRP